MNILEALNAGPREDRNMRRYAHLEYAPQHYVTVSDDEITSGFLIVWSTSHWAYRDHAIYDSLTIFEEKHPGAYRSLEWMPGTAPVETERGF